MLMLGATEATAARAFRATHVPGLSTSRFRVRIIAVSSEYNTGHSHTMKTRTRCSATKARHGFYRKTIPSIFSILKVSVDRAQYQINNLSWTIVPVSYY